MKPTSPLWTLRGKPTDQPVRWSGPLPYVKLRARPRRKIFDQPPQTVKRYLIDKNVRQFWAGGSTTKLAASPATKPWRIVLLTPAAVHWSVDNWTTVHDTGTRDTGLEYTSRPADSIIAG